MTTRIPRDPMVAERCTSCFRPRPVRLSEHGLTACPCGAPSANDATSDHVLLLGADPMTPLACELRTLVRVEAKVRAGGRKRRR